MDTVRPNATKADANPLAAAMLAWRELEGAPGAPIPQREAAERLELSQQLISRVESGKDIQLSTVVRVLGALGGNFLGALPPSLLRNLGMSFSWSDKVAEDEEPYSNEPRAVVSGQIGETGAVKFYGWQRPFEGWSDEIARQGLNAKADRQVLMFKVTSDLGGIPAGAWLLAQEIREGDERPRNYSAFVQYNRYGYAQPLEVFELAPDCEHLVLRMLGGKGSFSLSREDATPTHMIIGSLALQPIRLSGDAAPAALSHAAA